VDLATASLLHQIRTALRRYKWSGFSKAERQPSGEVLPHSKQREPANCFASSRLELQVALQTTAAGV
jgi:hypothetical protein